MSKKKPTSEISREMREAAAKKSAKQPKGKKQPAPAKPKPEKPKKVAKGKKVQPLESAEVSESTLLTLKADAERIDREITQQCEALGSEYGRTLAMHAAIEDFIDRELWRYCPTPYVSQAAWIKDKNKNLGSAAKLFNIVSGFKELKGHTTQKQRAEMGPRKRAVATSAVKKAKKKGKPVPVEIIEKAADPKVTETELRQTVVDADLGPEEETIISDTQERSPDIPYNPRTGGSGVVEGQNGTAQQFSGKVAHGIAIAKALYLDTAVHPPMSDLEWLECIVSMWEESSVDLAQVLIGVDRAQLEGMSNANAAALLAER